MNKNGFTLVELLVIIPIIAILASVAIVVYSSMTAKTRDSKRIGDLQTIKQALEFYRSDVHNYPAAADFPLNSKPASLTKAGITYLEPVPEDTDSSKQYYYFPTTIGGLACNNLVENTTCLAFILCAKKESENTTYNLSGCESLSCGTGSCDIGISSY